MSGMEDIQAQIQSLQTSVRRQRFAIVALATILAGCTLLGAVSPAGDATFDTITCKAWRVVDKDGKGRIRAATSDEGNAALVWFDEDGRGRIIVSTQGSRAGTMTFFDKDYVGRIHVSTSERGNASVSLYDKDGEERILAATNADGTVLYPTATGK